MQVRFPLALIVFTAAALRLYYLGETGGIAGYLPWADVKYYGGIVRENLASAEALVQWPWPPMASAHAIGYPALIAPLNALGIDPVYFRLVQIAIDSLACILAYLVAREFRLGEYAALSAAALYAVGQEWTWSAGFILAESLLPAMMLLALWLLLRLRAEDRPWIWAAAGAVIGVMPTLRTETVLFIAFVGAWGLFAAPGPIRQRLLKAGAGVVGFALVVLTASTASWAIRDNFGLSKNLKWYALYSGLGNIENPHGFVANDTLSQTILEERGMKYHSPESELFWKEKYLKAWADHPRYVLKVIAYRIQKILVDTEQHRLDRPSAVMQLALQGGVLYAIPFAFLFLLWRGDWLLAGLLVLPVAFAIGTIGLMHWEGRYVRYAHLTHLFAWAILIDALLKVPLRAPARYRF